MLVDYRNLSGRHFVRTGADKETIERVFGQVEYVEPDGIAGENGFVTGELTEAEYADKAAELGDVIQMIRL